MGLVEIIIIYLALGSPFAIFEAAVPAGSARRAAAMVFAVVAWPAYAGKLVFSRSDPAAAFLTTDPLLDIREELEALLTDGEAQAVFELREVFDRYTGLALALDASAARPYELLEISGHTSPAAGSRCLDRRNVLRLKRHLAAAREEFHSLASSLARGNRSQPAVKTLLRRLETELFDAAARPSTAARSASLLKPALHSRH